MSAPTYYVRGANGCFSPANPQPSAPSTAGMLVTVSQSSDCGYKCRRIETGTCGCTAYCGQYFVEREKGRFPPATPSPQPEKDGERDNCEFCLGAKGGVPGNGNVLSNGRICCDYCHAIMPAARSAPRAALTDDDLRAFAERHDPHLDGVKFGDLRLIIEDAQTIELAVREGGGQ